MLQLKRINEAAIDQIFRGDSDTLKWQDMKELEKLVDTQFNRLQKLRRQEAQRIGAIERIREIINDLIRTDAIEYLDDPRFPEAKKVKIVHTLHRSNRLVRSYQRFLKILKPFTTEVTERKNRPARILELASGSGEFTLALAALAHRKRLQVEVIGSDIVESYVREANQKARKRGIPATFIKINAFDMTPIENDTYDIVFIAQSMHHFSPGQLAVMIAQSQRVATTAFVGIDGYRSLALLGWAWISMLALQPDYSHDALISMRKLYSELELTFIGRLAAPEAKVCARTSWPGFSVLSVRT